MLRNKSLFFLFCILLISCKNKYSTNDFIFHIISPIESNVYYDDLPVVLSINKDIDSVYWTSSINGDLGKGSQISVNLLPGKHKIKVIAMGCEKVISITVLERFNKNLMKSKFRILQTPFDCIFKNQKYKAYIASLNGSADNFFIKKKNLNYLNCKDTNLEDEDGLKLFRCYDNINSVSPIPDVPILRYFKNTIENKSEKKFYIVNTKNQIAEPHYISFKKYYSSDNIDVWIPKKTLIDTVFLDLCINEVENIILDRVLKIFGKAADIDKNGKITIIFTQTINDEKKALGFFNPADFFKNNKDKNSVLYNPSSNEADIIYAAIPSGNPSDNYYYKAIAATIGHELTHAVSFTAKTYSRIIEGNLEAGRMDVFLDEGLSHLSENLIGYGFSGGNIKFFNKFLKDTTAYSFCKNSAAGLSDSAGQRGAMTLFLSWCFWKKGGMDWDVDNKVNLIDKGGISFLKELINSEYTGWEAIGYAFGTPTDTLFLEMLDSIIQSCNNKESVSCKKDPLTNEAVEFLPCMGEIDYNGFKITISEPEPKIKEGDVIKRFLPYSFAFLDNSLLEIENIYNVLTFYSENLEDSILFSLVR
ncbi:hypothetical protein E4N80_06370 [Treponema denticola]|uniref:hypothetical protein n=1 Tax=Treponema denticola TaxID=158 RepID=UPI0020A3ABE7|nr:hypothetical protein [Treponema denticola]UTC90352.1 hypothetical protein E4N87_06465 [Treponema denticola]UTD05127.1 hypothetical protein E4N80_06370 [Treponema denticola]